MRKRKKRIYAMLLCICMVLSLISAPVSAAETRGGGGGQPRTHVGVLYMDGTMYP